MIDTAYADKTEAKPGSDEELLEEIRQRFRDWDTEWKPIREERNTDLKYISGDPWDAKDRKARTDAGRPCINHDELGQYVNQLVNGVRQSKRGIKVDPQGEGSNDQTARLRQDLIRTIEYASNAGSVYAHAFQSMVEGSYAFFRISRQYTSNAAEDGGPALFDQEIVIRPVSNPNSVVYDPRCKEPDWSDARGCFLIERIPRKEFKRRWPRAQYIDFSLDYSIIASDWIFSEDMVVAEYWRIETTEKTKYLLESGEVVDNPRGRAVDKKRTVEEKRVMHYITNGLEILERSEDPEPGTLLPIIPMIGLERYADDAGFSRRKLFSLVRLARDPQMSLAYLNSQEMEEAGLTPKTPFMGYKGQFDSSRTQWEKVTREPLAFLEADVPDNWPAGQVPPLPTRVPFTPNFGAYEVAKDSARRAIQAAMGISPLPTAMQRQNEKSGVALQRIENLESLGSYHFIDGYDRALRLAGRVINQWIPAVYCRQMRPIHVRRPDDSYRQIQLNSGPYIDPTTQQQVCYPVEDVDHSISISTGPSYNSQREAVTDFLDTLIGQLPQLPVAPPQAAKLLSLAIQMKDLGPKGDQMAEIIAPTQGSPDQSLAQLQQAQAQAMQQGIMIQQLQAENQRLTVERQAKVVEGEYKLMTQRMQTEAQVLVERLKVDAQVAAAEIQTKTQVINERVAAIDELFKQGHQQMHDVRTQESQQQHELRMAQREYQQQLLEARAQQQEQPETPQAPAPAQQEE